MLFSARYGLRLQSAHTIKPPRLRVAIIEDDRPVCSEVAREHRPLEQIAAHQHLVGSSPLSGKIEADTASFKVLQPGELRRRRLHAVNPRAPLHKCGIPISFSTVPWLSDNIR